jgi:2-polyprenyl-3-methyl-5-hydroxy-6-metoxy-1,4-benzoquinol methylase
MRERGYQHGFSEQEHTKRAMYDVDGRVQKADKILAVLAEAGGALASQRLLDLSCSTGIMAARFATRVGQVTALDIDRSAVEHAQRNHSSANLEFMVANALDSGLPSTSFEVVICNQMYEHVPDPERLMQEIHRLLVPGGICYFGATNRLILIEPHYGRIPFLSWLPRSIASSVVRTLGRGDGYYERLLTLQGLRQLVATFTIEDYTQAVIEDPGRYSATDVVSPGGIRQRLALRLVRGAYPLMPGYVWILRKSS